MRRAGIGRARRPSLIGTVARTAVIAGTASAVSGNVQRSQVQRAQTEQEAAQFRQQQEVIVPTPTSTAATPISSGLIEELTKLAELKSLGVLNEDEFSAAKARLLGQ